MDPLDYMVEDCWLHLFQFLSAEDKQSLCQTSGSFQAMLEPQKTKWGLELILPFILKKFGSGYYYYYDDRYKKAIQSVLNLRHVCKAWKAGFDKYCGTHETDVGILFVDFIISKYYFNNVNFNNVNTPALQNFLTFFHAYDGNPFIGRRVSICAVPSPANEPVNQEGSSEKEVNNEGNAASEIVGIKEEDENDEAKENGGEDVELSNDDEGIEIDDEEEDDFDEDEYWRDYERARRERELKYRELLMELLSKYGKEIEYLYLGRTNNCAMLEAYKFLKIVLCNCLNLQSLEVQFSHFWDGGFQKQLEEYFKMNPLPMMHRLRELKLCDMNAHLENLMLEACGSNLQKLERQNSSEVPVSVWGNMKCLRHLTMSNCRFEQMDTLLRAINSPLEVLILKRITFDDVKHFKIDKFLLAIQHLPLKNVDVYGGGTLKESEPFPDDFPKHKTISNFSISVAVFSPNFLQFLPELQGFFVNGAECLWRPLFSK